MRGGDDRGEVQAAIPVQPPLFPAAHRRRGAGAADPAGAPSPALELRFDADRSRGARARSPDGCLAVSAGTDRASLMCPTWPSPAQPRPLPRTSEPALASDGLGAPRARPPERSGDRGAARAKAKGVRGGEAPRI